VALVQSLRVNSLTFTKSTKWCIMCPGGEDNAQDCERGGVSCLSQAVSWGAPPTDPATHRRDSHHCTGSCRGVGQLSCISYRCHHYNWKVSHWVKVCHWSVTDGQGHSLVSHWVKICHWSVTDGQGHSLVSHWVKVCHWSVI